jgi:Ferritin-like domain
VRQVIHVKILQGEIRTLGGKPVPKCTYNFEKTALTSVGKFLSVAQFRWRLG